MTPITLSPYLNFGGKTREAIQFYQSVLGGTLTLQTFSEIPGMPVPPGMEDGIMHSQLEADGIVIQASEGAPGSQVSIGNNVHMCLTGSDLARLTTIFNALAVGGTVKMPLAKQFWGSMFGMLLDRFGVQWMVNAVEN